MKKTIVITEVETTPSVERGNPWQTVLFNDEVIFQVPRAAGHFLEKIAKIVLEK